MSVRLPGPRETAGPLAAAFVVALICWFFGVDAWHAILLGAAITVAGAAAVASGRDEGQSDVQWRPRRATAPTGSRQDVLNLSQTLRAGWGTVSVTAERRLILLARRRLALEGLDLQDPAHRAAIEARLGPGAYAVLTEPRGSRLRLRTLLGCLDRLDALNTTHYPAPARRLRRLELRPRWGRKEPHA